jgi:hypothetical protein
MLTLETVKSISLQTNIGICRTALVLKHNLLLRRGHTIHVKKHERRMFGILEE